MRFKTFLLLITLFLIGSISIFAQEGDAKTDAKTDKKEDKVEKVKLTKEEAEGLVITESAILVYSQLSGRNGLNQIRKTTVEIGKLEITNPDGTVSNGDYELRVLRGDGLMDEKVRLDQRFPSSQYSLIYKENQIFGLINNTAFEPRQQTTNYFTEQIWHGIEALLRYKENGSKVTLEKEEKEMGVDYYVVKVVDKQNRATTFYISKKYRRVMKIEYESEGVKYRRKFYDHNYAQRTLVPYRTVLWANDKQIEEKTIATITFGQDVGEDLFAKPKL